MSSERIQVSRRWSIPRWWVPHLTYSNLLIIANIISLLFWALLLAGCASTNGLKNVYLMSIMYNTALSNATASSLVADTGLAQSLATQLATSNSTLRELRVGYLSMCISLRNGDEVCSKNQDDLAAAVESSAGGDPLNLLQLAHSIQSEIFFYPLIIIAIGLIFFSAILLSRFPGWHEEEESEGGSIVEVKPFPSRLLTRTVFVSLGLASAIGCVSAFWQHVGASTASIMTRHLTYGLTITHTGSISMAFGWTAATFVVISAIGVLLTILSVQVLEAMER